MTERPNTSPRILLVAMLAAAVSACASLGASGPGTGTLRSAESESYAEAPITVVDLDRATTAQITSSQKAQSFAQVFGDPGFSPPLIERGDIIAVTIWEAPPAVLFGNQLAGRGAFQTESSQTTSIPDQRVDEAGALTIPFVGQVEASGRTTSQVQSEIMRRLDGKANDPQVLVRLVDNQANNVTVMGKVANTSRIPITTRGERLLDILAQAGGPTEPVEKTTIRVARGDVAASMPLDAVILDPSQNIPLRSEDVVTVIHQPYSFIALGAVTQNAEVPFEGSGLTLAQALGRIGGLRDDRADIRGVFIFRFEDGAALGGAEVAALETTQDGRVPVIYRLDLSDAAGLFIAQDFQVRDDDVLYVSTAPGSDLQKFLQTLSNVALSTLAIKNSL